MEVGDRTKMSIEIEYAWNRWVEIGFSLQEIDILINNLKIEVISAIIEDGGEKALNYIQLSKHL